MTFRERLMMEKPNAVQLVFGSVGPCRGCPHEHGYEDRENRPCANVYESVDRKFCNACWDRKIPNCSVEETSEDVTKAAGAIKDSGDRTEFSTGACRDMHAGKGDMASVPWEAILRLSRHYENGAEKYERWNFRKGIPISSFIDSACRHLAKYQCGQDDEDHLAAAAFNVLGAMLMENTLPEMQDLPLRKGKKTFDYFEENE